MHERHDWFRSNLDNLTALWRALGAGSVPMASGARLSLSRCWPQRLWYDVDRVDTGGTVTIRHHSRLHHIGIGRTHAGTHVILLVHDLDIRVVNAATGELLRELVLDPNRDYQPTGAPKGPTHKPRK